MDFFEKVEKMPPDAILGLTLAYAADKRAEKVNLGVGAYKTTDLKPLILNTVKKAEQILIEKETSKDYLPIDGSREYVELTKHLIFGKLLPHIYGAQTTGGTAALQVGGAFLKEQGFKKIYISDPTWANHFRIFKYAGLEVHTYPYFDRKKHGFDFKGMMETLEQLEKGSVVLLQACCHNPTGFDPTPEQWQEICKLMKEKTLFPFFDCAYQGFGEDLEKDVASVRHFLKSDLQFALAVSHAKNFGLYAERAGALYFVCRDEDQAHRVGSHIKMVIRGLYSNPPCHGARIVSTILQDPELKEHWEKELTVMKERITEMRHALSSQLQTKSTSRSFDFLARQKGMFSYTGLEKEQVERLISDYGIYLPKDGRINVAGLNTKNLDYVADAIIACCENYAT